METKQKQQRKYKLHYNLRRKGNTVVAREKLVTKRAKEVSPIEQRWLAELVGFGYCVGDGLFTPPPLFGFRKLMTLRRLRKW